MGCARNFRLVSDYSVPMLQTETPNAAHTTLDQYPSLELVQAFVDDQLGAVNAVRAASTQIAAALDAAVPRIASGGRLVYVGAGTSGRLGLLDSVELYPTFSWPKARAVSLLAGGMHAMVEAVEGAEDDAQQGARDVRAAGVGPNDVVLLLAASGATPFVMGALQAAKELGALTVGMANNVDAPVVQAAHFGVCLDTGPEVISGSTRLKAGTSQKIALNTFSSALMVRLNKVYGNLMVDVKPTNAKLFKRCIALTVHATGCDDATAQRVLSSCDHRVKTAIVAIKKRMDVAAAQSLLDGVNGSVRAALE